MVTDRTGYLIPLTFNSVNAVFIISINVRNTRRLVFLSSYNIKKLRLSVIVSVKITLNQYLDFVLPSNLASVGSELRLPRRHFTAAATFKPDL